MGDDSDEERRMSMFDRLCGRSVPFASVLLIIAMGCNGTQSAEQALEKQFEDNRPAHRKVVAKFAGKVLVDGKPAVWKSNQATLVILINLKNPGPPGKPPNLIATCDLQGKFAFNTYALGDGIPVGSYVVCIVQLRPIGRPATAYIGPDLLKNLYNDPDKNRQEPQFKVEVAPPGKTDYVFDLAVQEKPAKTPGPKAITQIRFVK
jgi:hypothetical protein